MTRHAARIGVGEVFDYANALHDLESLDPGAVTDAVVWRLKVLNPSKTDFHFGVEIAGFIERKKEPK